MWWGFYLPPCRKIPIARSLVTIMTISATFSNALWRCYKPWEKVRWCFRNRRSRGSLKAATGTSLYYLRGHHHLYFHGLLDLDELWGLLPHSWEQRQSLFSFHLRPHFTCSALVSPCTMHFLLSFILYNEFWIKNKLIFSMLPQSLSLVSTSHSSKW